MIIMIMIIIIIVVVLDTGCALCTRGTSVAIGPKTGIGVTIRTMRIRTITVMMIIIMIPVVLFAKEGHEQLQAQEGDWRHTNKY